MKSGTGKFGVRKSKRNSFRQRVTTTVTGWWDPGHNNGTARKRAEFDLIQGGYDEPSMFVAGLGARIGFTALYESRICTIGFGIYFWFCAVSYTHLRAH